jgi:hypothetical protein
MIFLVTPGCRLRCNHLAMASPVAPRRLWLLHLVGVLLCGVMILAVSAGLIALGGWLLSRLPKRPEMFVPDPLSLAVHLGAGLALAVTILQSHKPSLNKIPARWTYVLSTAAILVGVPALIDALAALPLYSAILPLGLALIIALRTYNSLPKAFALVPLQPEPGDVAADRVAGRIPGALPVEGSPRPAIVEHDWSALSGERPARGIRYRWLLLMTIYRELAKKPIIGVLALPFLIFFGMLLSGGIFSESELRFTNIVMAAYILYAFSGPFLNQLHRLDHLPLSRRRLFALLTLPTAALLYLGYGAGWILAMGGQGSHEPVEYKKETCCHYTRVPIEFCEIAWNGQPPENGSPWGELHPAWTVPLYKGSRAVLYSPLQHAGRQLGRIRGLAAQQGGGESVRSFDPAGYDPGEIPDGR